MNKFKISLILIIVLFSCNSNIVKISDIHVINMEDGFDDVNGIKLSDICSSIEYIPLETKDNCLVTAEDNIIVKDNIYIKANSNGKNCQVFGLDGSFKYPVGRIGRAYGELNRFSSLNVDKSLRVIIGDESKVVIYKDGEPIESISFSQLGVPANNRVSEMLIVNDNYCFNLYDYKDEKNSFIIVDTLINTLFTSSIDKNYAIEDNTEVIDGKRTGVRVRSTPTIYTYNYDLYLVSPNNDTIFCYNNRFEESPKYILQYKDSEVVKQPAYAFFIETDSYLFYKFIYKNKPTYNTSYTLIGYAIYDKIGRKPYPIAFDNDAGMFGIINDIDNGICFYPKYSDNEYLYQMVEAFDFINAAKVSGSDQMKRIASNITEISNPILVKAKLK